MKKTFIFFLTFCMLLLLGGCGSGDSADIQTPDSPPVQSAEDGNSEETPNTVPNGADTSDDGVPQAAVVYFSGTGNTADVAENLAQVLDIPVYALQPEEPYTDEDLNYRNEDCRANQEMRDEAARPALVTDQMDLDDYDTIYLGYPIWSGNAPRIINTFLESFDLSGKEIYTFCTSGGSGIEQSVRNLQNLYPDIQIVSGQRFSPGASQEELQTWVDELREE